MVLRKIVIDYHYLWNPLLRIVMYRKELRPAAMSITAHTTSKEIPRIIFSENGYDFIDNTYLIVSTRNITFD